jgi:hypothetical protein
MNWLEVSLTVNGELARQAPPLEQDPRTADGDIDPW